MTTNAGSSAFYTSALIVFFALNGLLWVVWGTICLFTPEAWSGALIPGIEVYDLSDAIARTEVRSMYGGLQIAIGLIGLIAIFRPVHRATVLLFYVLALTGLSLARFYGLVVEDSAELIAFGIDLVPEKYNAIALGMYEGPYTVFAWILFLMRPKTLAA